MFQFIDIDDGISIANSCDTTVLDTPNNEILPENTDSDGRRVMDDNVSPLFDHLGYAKPTQLVHPVVSVPVAARRKRNNAIVEPGDVMTVEMFKDARRKKNNEASKVSRAKRKKVRAALVDEEIQLSARNSQLKERVHDMTRDCGELKKRLFDALRAK